MASQRIWMAWRSKSSWMLGIGRKEAEAEVPLVDLCRTYGFSKRSYYRWKAKYGGMEASDVHRLWELEEENRRLKAMYAELSLEHRVLQEVVEKMG